MGVKLLGSKLSFNRKQKIEEPKAPRDPAPKLKAFRALFLILVLIFMLLSIKYLTNPEARVVKAQAARIDEFFMNPSKYVDQQGYYSFAEQFLKDYLTLDGVERDLSLYSTLDLNLAVSSKLKLQEVVGVYPEKLIRINPDQTVVRARVYLSSYFIGAKVGDPDVRKFDTVTFEVPIYGKEGSFLVNEQPQIVPTTQKAEESWTNLTLNEVNGDPAAEIMTDVESFLKAYFEGNSNDVGYFTDLKLEGLKGKVKYGNIEDSKVYKPDGKTSLVKLDCIAFYNEVGMPMHFELKLVKKEKWKVEFVGAKCAEFEKYKEVVEETEE